MATDKPRFSITLDPALLLQVLDFKEKNNLSTQSKAIQRLIEIGIREANCSITSRSLLSDELKLIDDYRRLSTPGKEYIRQTIEMAVRSYSEGDDAIPDMEAN